MSASMWLNRPGIYQDDNLKNYCCGRPLTSRTASVIKSTEGEENERGTEREAVSMEKNNFNSLHK